MPIAESAAQTPTEPDSRLEQQENVSNETFTDWAKNGAIPIARWEMNDGLADYLEASLEGKRILFIGEPGHFFSEKYDIQLMLIEHLARRGYRHLFIEGLGASASEVVDEYVRTGEVRRGQGADAVSHRSLPHRRARSSG